LLEDSNLWRKKEEALASLERAVALAPDYPAARNNLDWVREELAARDEG